MIKVAKIRFKPYGKLYDFECGAYVVNTGDEVIVETELGLGFGTIAAVPVNCSKDSFKKPLKKIFRIANENDIQKKKENTQLEIDAFNYCKKSIKETKLSMNLFSVESSFDKNKLTFFFTADGRVDFRQLVKMLVKKFPAKIEMRQVGVRNQTRMCGGIGRCGRQLCCRSFIEKFEPISIRMAKEQNLSLNPTKISGLCGRLMCCLTFENNTYIKLKEKMPKIGKKITTKQGVGKVIRLNPISSCVTVIYEEDGIEEEVNLDEIIKGK